MCIFFSLPSNIKISIGKIIPAIFLYSSNSICLVLCLSKNSFIYIFSSLSPVPGHYLHRNVRSNSGWCTQSVSVLKLQYRQVIGTYQAGWGRGCLLFTSPIFANFKIFLLQSPFAFCFLYIYPARPWGKNGVDSERCTSGDCLHLVCPSSEIIK